MDFDFQNIETVNIPLSKLEENKGQIEGVPRNPRVVKDANFKKLVKSILEDTEFLSLNCLHVFQQGKKYVVCNGNMHCDVIIARWEKLTGKKATKEAQP